MRLHSLFGMALTVPLMMAACGGDDGDGGGNHAGTGGRGGSGTSATGGSGGSVTTGGSGGSMSTGGSGGGRGGSGGTTAGLGGSSGEAGMPGGAGEPGEAGMAGMSGEAGGNGMTTFRVRIENHSDETSTPTPFSPGVWTVAAGSDTLFTEGTADWGDGLEELAEEGAPETLAGSLSSDDALYGSGVFDELSGSATTGKALPGEAFEFDVTASPDAPNLAFASMFGQSNNVFIGPDGDGIPLFDEQGDPLPERDVTDLVKLWDAGTERNQAPLMGPDQAPREASSGVGPEEATIAPFSDTTRALPTADAIVDVSVSEASGTYTFVVENVSGDRHALVTPISPVFFATHDDTWQLFEDGVAAPAALESLAEDGSPTALVAANSGASGVGTADAVTIRDGGTSAGPAPTGGSFTFSVMPDTGHPRVSFATMVGTTNDAFLALPPAGVALLDDNGDPRPAADVEADVRASLQVWDAGTEANEVPGIGKNQAPRQSATDTGPVDPNPVVRPYGDDTNDLAGAGLGGFAAVTVVNGSAENEFQVTVSDTADTTAFPGKVSPLVWAVHDDTATLFHSGGKASAGLEHLAEDGDPSTFVNELGAMSGVGSSGAVDTAVGASYPGPIAPGQSFSFTVTADATHRFLSLAAMVAPSNDTFMAFDPGGIELIDSIGDARSDSDLAYEITQALRAWDAGTEANQAGAAGPDQIGAQAAPNTGAAEGNGHVRVLADPVWTYPSGPRLFNVTVKPMQ